MTGAASPEFLSLVFPERTQEAASGRSPLPVNGGFLSLAALQYQLGSF